MLQLGGFPEPYFSKSEIEAKRWSTNYRSLLVNQESISIATISDLSKLELLSLRLPELVGSPLSLNALREDLQIAHKTISRWISILENMVASHLLKWVHYQRDVYGEEMELRYFRDTDKREVDFLQQFI